MRAEKKLSSRVVMEKEDAAVLSTFFECFRSFQGPETSQLKLQHDPDARFGIADIKEYFYNSVAIKQPNDKSALIEELNNLQAKLAKPLTVWITAETEAPGLEEMFKEHFKTPGPFYGMMLKVSEANITPTPPGITVEQVTTKEDAQHFARILSEIFGMPNAREPLAAWVEAQSKLANPTGISYLAKVNGEIAGVSSLIIDRSFKDFKCGGFYNACVLPAFRKSGVATAMACHRVNVAKELGMEYLSIILMSDAMARGYCTKLGFKNYKTLTPYLIG